MPQDIFGLHRERSQLLLVVDVLLGSGLGQSGELVLQIAVLRLKVGDARVFGLEHSLHPYRGRRPIQRISLAT